MAAEEVVARRVAGLLLGVGALQVNVRRPFRWSGGWLSPVYCDNRRTLSFPEVRNYIKEQLAELVRRHYIEAEVVAAVATAGIAHGVLVADVLGMPFCYVRPKPKEHGLHQQIEGVLAAGSRVVVIEDLLSTGASSARVIEVLQQAGARVVGLAAIFSYGFQQAAEALAQQRCPHRTLSHFAALLQQAMAQGRISVAELDVLRRWQQDPAQWTPPA